VSNSETGGREAGRGVSNSETGVEGGSREPYKPGITEEARLSGAL